MNDTSRDAVETLAEIHAAKYDGTVHGAFHLETADTLRVLMDERDRLREALKPFSDEAGWWLERNYSASDVPVEGFDDYQGGMTCGDLFRARSALQEKPNE